MYGKYADRRVYQHFVHTYSRVPYLDHEIFNVSERPKRLQRQAEQRASSAREGLERITAMADKLEKSLKDFKTSREQILGEFRGQQARTERKNEQPKICQTPPTNKQSGENPNKDDTPKSNLLATATSNTGSLRRSYRRYAG